jgi:hypothetical protein
MISTSMTVPEKTQSAPSKDSRGALGGAQEQAGDGSIPASTNRQASRVVLDPSISVIALI